MRELISQAGRWRLKPPLILRFSLLLEAWKEAPAERPSLPELVQALKKMEALTSRCCGDIMGQRSCVGR